MEAKYFKDPKKISHIVEGGISNLLESNEERTIVETPRGGIYMFPTGEFNKLRGYLPKERTISSLTGIGVALDLKYPEKPERLNYPEPD